MLQARVRDRLSPVRGNVLARIRACRPGDGFEHRANFEPIPLDHRSRTIRLVSRSKKYVTRYSPSSITTSEEEQILRAKDTTKIQSLKEIIQKLRNVNSLNFKRNKRNGKKNEK